MGGVMRLCEGSLIRILVCCGVLIFYELVSAGPRVGFSSVHAAEPPHECSPQELSKVLSYPHLFDDLIRDAKKVLPPDKPVSNIEDVERALHDTTQYALADAQTAITEATGARQAENLGALYMSRGLPVPVDVQRRALRVTQAAEIARTKVDLAEAKLKFWKLWKSLKDYIVQMNCETLRNLQAPSPH